MADKLDSRLVRKFMRPVAESSSLIGASRRLREGQETSDLSGLDHPDLKKAFYDAQGALQDLRKAFEKHAPPVSSGFDAEKAKKYLARAIREFDDFAGAVDDSVKWAVGEAERNGDKIIEPKSGWWK